MANTAPLVSRNKREPIAWLNAPIACLGHATSIVDTTEFLQHVKQLASQLPDGKYAINLCENRYLFLLALCAAIVRGQTNLLPSNKNIATQQRMNERYTGAYIVHDGVTELAELASINVAECEFGLSDQASDEVTLIPQINLDHIAAISFTSGSTGDAQPNIKSWRTLLESTQINQRYMLPDQQQTFYHLATVPGQHMWGFETSVLMALFAKVCIVDARPLYPQDIRSILNRLPIPRVLIATPLHLRALNTKGHESPSLANVLCATAPLSQTLAVAIEAQFSTQLTEVYGCSEVGSMAFRRTAKTDVWEKFDGLSFSENSSGSVVVDAPYLPATVTLSDTIEMLDDRHFRLQGRASDQINIAGKRGSLTEVNKVLMSFTGIQDGIVFFPPQDRPVPRLVALVVMAQKADKKALQQHFRRYLDAAFVPRPIIQVVELPREDSGKLVQTRLVEFYQNQLSDRSVR